MAVAASKQPAVRDPESTRRRILEAALQEFSARGFAGARVGAIARRARINKRMLYHYFQDKEGLFRAVLRHKIAERQHQVQAQAPAGDPISSLPLWFKQNGQDAGWVRLLAWESLQSADDKVLDEAERRRIARRAVAEIKKSQAAGSLRKDVAAAHVLLAKISLAMFPFALPQVARIMLGGSPHQPRFQREYAQFLEVVAAAFRPASRR